MVKLIDRCRVYRPDHPLLLNALELLRDSRQVRCFLRQYADELRLRGDLNGDSLASARDHLLEAAYWTSLVRNNTSSLYEVASFPNLIGLVRRAANYPLSNRRPPRCC